MIDVFGTARIQHAKTGKIYDIDRNDLEFETNGTDDRSMGMEIEHIAIFDHNQLGELIWTVWEHPVGTFNYNDYDVGFHELLEDFSFEIDNEEEHQNRKEELIEWFKDNYEDPANNLLYDSKAGDYKWMRGGPYDARQVLEQNFPNEFEESIELAVEEIESDGIEVWSQIYFPKNPLQQELFPDDSLKDIEDELNTLIDNAPKPKTAPAFALGDDNRFHIIDPPDNQPVDSQNNLLNGLRTITNDLLQSLRGANAHQDLIPIIEKYKEALLGDEISISQLYWCGIRLDKIAQIIKRGIAEKELPSLPTNTETYLESALEIHGTYIMSNPEGQILVRASVAYRQPPEQTEALKTAGEQFANSFAENSNLFGEDVQEHFRDFSNDIGNGQYPERSNQSFGNTVSNFVLGVLKIVGAGAVMAIIGSAVTPSVPAMAASALGTEAINAVCFFLIDKAPLLLILAAPLAGELSWLASAAHLLERIRLAIRRD